MNKGKTKTFERTALDKLREIEPTTQTKWANALGYKTRNAFWGILKRLVNEGSVIEDTTRKPYRYTVKNGMNNRFKVKIYGLSEDMEDFIFEKDIFYEENKTKFWTSFYRTCSEMIQARVDLSDKQLNIIYREYNKVSEERLK